MRKDEHPYHFLIIEDNWGDFVLIEEYLSDIIQHPVLEKAETFLKAKNLLKENPGRFDLVFLDLSLPDLSGEPLIREVIELCSGLPVVALTGFSDLDFSIKSLSLGISDYLLKEELTPAILYKSIIYSIQRGKFLDDLQKSEKRYSDLFQLSPLPMWVYELDTLRFLDVNEAAVDLYGYRQDEFLQMKIPDINALQQSEGIETCIDADRIGQKFNPKSIFRHLKKDGSSILVEAKINHLTVNNQAAVLVLVNDVTDRLRYVEMIEIQNKTFREIAWIQSHVVRAPLARLVGLISLLDTEISNPTEQTTELITFITNSATELDKIIRDISSKSEDIILLENDGTKP